MTEWERDAWEFEQAQDWDNEPLDDVLYFAHLDEPPTPDDSRLPIYSDDSIPF